MEIYSTSTVGANVNIFKIFNLLWISTIIVYKMCWKLLATPPIPLVIEIVYETNALILMLFN